ncbi:PREDICTED: probable methyltransferase-like protein 15 homolog [Priapulus caudatus]|uniref:Probable methyltransferase-like protein 15 homolog n=1 Tax=Priapulus caudatus TaxID=37621 RepID=A0ABM1DVS1_PRICU|nr:PREDICTED: probable methyltransferase-like protein 15 homolog [Priapulus caudatus]
MAATVRLFSTSLRYACDRNSKALLVTVLRLRNLARLQQVFTAATCLQRNEGKDLWSGQNSVQCLPKNNHVAFISDVSISTSALEGESQGLHSNEDSTDVRKPPHVPVMLDEVLELLDPKLGKVLLDMTFGAGGHTKALLQRGAKVVALDRDPVANKMAQNLALQYGDMLTPLLGRFSELAELMAEKNIKEQSFDGILLDAGCSSMQMDTGQRGFSISHDGPLDMRMDCNRDLKQPTAYDVVNHMEEVDLAKILKRYGEERQAKCIAKAIAETRLSFGLITTTGQLADVVASATRSDHGLDMIQRYNHSATKTFMAIRIFVNNELNELFNAVTLAHRYLRPGGKFVAMTFHSLEDRVVKRHLHGIDIDEKFSPTMSAKYRNSNLWHSDEMMKCCADTRMWDVQRKKVITPTEEEVHHNPRSRSAKLRFAMKM